MRNFLFIAIALLFLMCNNKHKVEIDLQHINSHFSKMKNSDIPFFLENDFPKNWYRNNEVFILEDNPDFQIRNFDSLKFIIIPSLNIPVNELAGYEDNILGYFTKGEMSVYNAGELLVFENDTLRLKFNIRYAEIDGTLRRAFNKSDFSAYLKNTHISMFEEADAYFNVNIISNFGAIFSLPTGTFILKDKSFSVLMPAGKVYDIDNMHKLFFETENEFNKYMKNLVSLASHTN